MTKELKIGAIALGTLVVSLVMFGLVMTFTLAVGCLILWALFGSRITGWASHVRKDQETRRIARLKQEHDSALEAARLAREELHLKQEMYEARASVLEAKDQVKDARKKAGVKTLGEQVETLVKETQRTFGESKDKGKGREDRSKGRQPSRRPRGGLPRD